MMKYMLVLVLLHLCYSENLYDEMIGSLKILDGLYRAGKANVTDPTKMEVPGDYMKKHPKFCKGVFSRKLENLLKNVTVHEDDQMVLNNLQANLKAMGHHKENVNCTMKDETTKFIFLQYALFVRKLNSRK